MGEHTVRVFQDKQGKWRWSRVAGNGEIIADSGEGYEHRVDCMDSMVAVNRQPFMLEIVGDAETTVFDLSGDPQRELP